MDAAACTSAIAVRAVYASVSTVQLAPIVPPRAVARNVSLAVGGVVLDDGNPVLGATLSASISTTTDISAQVQLQNYQLQSQTTLPDSTIEMQYLVDLGNNGAPLTHAIARLISGDPAAFVLTPALSFGAVATTAKVTDTSDSLTPAIDTQRLATIGKSSPVVCARRSRRGGGTARP